MFDGKWRGTIKRRTLIIAKGEQFYMEEIMKSKVYVQIDENNLIIRCEGGYTTPEDLTGWTYIDEGTGDKYNLCQSHYFDGG